jgi:hypothetical protein
VAAAAAVTVAAAAAFISRLRGNRQLSLLAAAALYFNTHVGDDVRSEDISTAKDTSRRYVFALLCYKVLLLSTELNSSPLLLPPARLLQAAVPSTRPREESASQLGATEKANLCPADQ